MVVHQFLTPCNKFVPLLEGLEHISSIKGIGQTGHILTAIQLAHASVHAEEDTSIVDNDTADREEADEALDADGWDKDADRDRPAHQFHHEAERLEQATVESVYVSLVRTQNKAHRCDIKEDVVAGVQDSSDHIIVHSLTKLLDLVGQADLDGDFNSKWDQEEEDKV